MFNRVDININSKMLKGSTRENKTNRKQNIRTSSKLMANSTQVTLHVIVKNSGNNKTAVRVCLCYLQQFMYVGMLIL